MNMRMLLLMLAALGTAFAGLSVPSWELSQDTYRPGANGVMTIEVANPLITGVEVLSINTVNVDVTAPPQVVMTGEQFVGDIEPGGSTKVSLPFKIPKDAKSAIYSVELKISGVSDRAGGGFYTFSRRLIVPVTVVNEPILVLNTDKQLIGGIDTVGLTITNNGGEATNVRVRIPETSEVSLYGADEVYLPSASGSVTTNLTLDSRGAEDGPTDVPFTVEYEDEIGIKRSENATLRMTVRKERLDIKFDQQSVVITKTEGNLTLSLRNDGNEELEDVRLSFTNDTLRLKDSGELKFGDLEPGQSATASAAVFADLPPGVNLVEAELSWIEKDVQNEETRQLPVTIASDADVGVYLEAKPLPLTTGSEHTISVLVSNLGSYRIDNVDVSLESPSLRSMDISDRQYIGGLQTDDFSTVQFLMKVNATSEGSYPVRITVNYRDQSGEWKQKIITQSISVYSPLQAQDNTIPLVAGAVALAAAVWWYFWFRKAQK